MLELIFVIIINALIKVIFEDNWKPFIVLVILYLFCSFMGSLSQQKTYCRLQIILQIAVGFLFILNRLSACFCKQHERRVVCKVEKPENQMVYMYTFIAINTDSSPEYLIKFYCKRGLMENFIKESKSSFDFASVSSHTRIVNANRLQVHSLAYNIFNWFRRLALSANMRKQHIDTVRLKLLKIAAKVVRSARYSHSSSAVVALIKVNSMRQFLISVI